MGFHEKVIIQIGGMQDAIYAYLLTISFKRVTEVVFYAFLGATVTEAVKEAVKWYKRKKGLKDEE